MRFAIRKAAGSARDTKIGISPMREQKIATSETERRNATKWNPTRRPGNMRYTPTMYRQDTFTVLDGPGYHEGQLSALKAHGWEWIRGVGARGCWRTFDNAEAIREALRLGLTIRAETK